jgi:hypothetical protein
MQALIKYLLLFGCMYSAALHVNGQEPVTAANKFIASLSKDQQSEMIFPFDSEERYNFHFIPRTRKGIAIGELNDTQKQAAIQLMRSCLSEQATQKITDIISLEYVLKAIENRPAEDHFRDADKYYFTVFGVPGEKTIWGWRIEGHHVAFNFSVDQQRLVAGTPGFLGANPAVVKEGPAKGKEVLKDETEAGFAFVKSLDETTLSKAIFSTAAPGDIITAANRKAMIEQPVGLSYTEMTPEQKDKLLGLINLYVQRFTRLFAADMLREIQKAGLDKLRFAWAGNTDRTPGKAYYYRIQGPTIIIEYDNSQNNANHVHTVVRDLLHDFGGDELLEHYRAGH